MSSQTRIVILKMRTIIYTGIFIFLVLVLGVLLYLMFGKNTQNTDDFASPASSTANSAGSITSLTENTASLYDPGCYHSVLKLGDYSVDVSVTVNADRIESIQLPELSGEVAGSYPLLEPALTDLSEKILAAQSTEYLIYDENMQYTQTALTDAINTALKKAEKK